MNEQTIFATALTKQNPDERQAFLSEACGQDAELRAQVEELLAAGEKAGSFLEFPPHGIGSTAEETPHDKDTLVYGESHGSLPILEPCDKPDRIGKLGVYEIIEVVGQGGMGSVLRAFDTKLSRVVAVKVMAPELAANPTAVKRFLREAVSAAAVVHDHVVTIHAVDDQSRPPYLVMEFIEGQTLQQKIDREGALPLKQVLRIGSQMAAGLAAAHKTGLIHRDVKPANILLENGVQRVKITDFGLARAADDVEMTRTGMIAGTPQYMSPEQAHGQSIDCRSDLFSLGSVLYTMCTGRPGFRAESTMGTLRRVCDDTPRPIREVNAEIPDWLCATIDKLLAKRPEDRFQTAGEVADLLSQYLAHLQQPATMPLPATPKIHVAAEPAIVPAFKDASDGHARSSSSVIGILAACLLLIMVPFFALFVLAAFYFLYASTSLSVKNADSDRFPHAERAGTLVGTVPAQTQEKEKWISLFNGTDLSEWETHPDEPGKWQVENGAISGVGPPSYLYSKRDDLTDFQLRFETRINTGGDGGLLVRAPFIRSTTDGHAGYEAQIQAGPPLLPGWRTGAIGFTEPKRGWRMLQDSLKTIDADVWVPMEIIVQGNRIETRLNGEKVAEYIDLDWTYSSGRIVLQQSAANSKVMFRNLEFKVLPATDNIPFLAVAPFDTKQAKKLQEDCAQGLGVDVENVNSLGMKLQLIPPGEFLMGQTQEETDRLVQSLEQGGADEYSKFVARFSSPQHKVRITQPMYFGTCEVTVGQYRKFIQETKHVGTTEQLGLKGLFNWTSSAAEPNPEERAVIGVSWDDAKAFCKWLSKEEGVTYDLPSEAQWEYACRAGTTTAWSFGDEAAKLGEYAVFGHASFWPAEVVGSKAPNPFGLFDMHGNADEWCLDWHFRDFYAQSPSDDPVCTIDPKDKASGRVARGGGAVSAPWWTRSTTRAYDFPVTPNTPKGFRVVAVGRANLAKIQARKVEREKLAAEATGWVKLFNGQDLTGWKTLPDQSGPWKVKDGILVGSGEPVNLFSERGDYKNFQLRLEAKVSAGEDSGVFLRAPFDLPRGKAPLEAQITGLTESEYNTGSLWGVAGGEVRESPIKVDEWFKMDVLADGDHLVIKVNDKTMVDLRDAKREFTTGHIALQHLERAGEVQFRKIEIKELPAQ